MNTSTSLNFYTPLLHSDTPLLHSDTPLLHSDTPLLGIFIDLTKAFDTCDIDILLKRLDHYGFRGISNQWVENYLKGRNQFSSIKGLNSSIEYILCGVSQGSILGPVFFLNSDK